MERKKGGVYAKKILGHTEKVVLDLEDRHFVCQEILMSVKDLCGRHITLATGSPCFLEYG